MLSRPYQLALRFTLLPAVIVFIFGLMFVPLRDALFDEQAANTVILQAVPFVAFFISVLLLYIMFIAFVGIRLHKRISHRTHQAIEWTLVAGILVGLVSMFQAVEIVGYRYGFLLLLFSLLSFILWTHVTPRAAIYDSPLKLNQPATLIGAVGGVIFVLIIVAVITNAAAPAEPFGYRQRQWDSFDEERQAEVRDDALSDFQTREIPYIVVLSIVPGLLLFWGLRELTLPADTEARAASL